MTYSQKTVSKLDSQAVLLKQEQKRKGETPFDDFDALERLHCRVARIIFPKDMKSAKVLAHAR